MKLMFFCGVCGKQETLDLSDKNKTYLIGRDMEGLSVKLCGDERSTLSRIQAHIKWDRNSWRVFDGWQPDTVTRQDTKMQKPGSFAGTYLKGGDTYRLLSYGTGEELRQGDTVFFVATTKANRQALQQWISKAGADGQAAFYKYDGFISKQDVEYYEGFKYKFTVESDEDEAARTRSGNIYMPYNFTRHFETGKPYLNSCLSLDIRNSTAADLETQRDYWIPQFNSILNELLPLYKDYLLILVGDGAYVCFLGERPNEDVNFSFAVKYLELLKAHNASNRKNGVAEWKVRLAVNNGKDLLAAVDIAGQKSLNVYGNTITTLARIMAYGKSEGDDIMAGIPFHQEFNNQKFYKSNFIQTAMEVTDNHGVKHHYYVYKRAASPK